jgi:hypothetical protein
MADHRLPETITSTSSALYGQVLFTSTRSGGGDNKSVLGAERWANIWQGLGRTRNMPRIAEPGNSLEAA